jgi:hypothetical protein
MENEVQILKAQIQALKELVSIKDQIIQELKAKQPIATITSNFVPYTYIVPTSGNISVDYASGCTQGYR